MLQQHCTSCCSTPGQDITNLDPGNHSLLTVGVYVCMYVCIIICSILQGGPFEIVLSWIFEEM